MVKAPIAQVTLDDVKALQNEGQGIAADVQADVGPLQHLQNLVGQLQGAGSGALHRQQTVCQAYQEDSGAEVAILNSVLMILKQITTTPVVPFMIVSPGRKVMA